MNSKEKKIRHAIENAFVDSQLKIISDRW